MAFVPDSLKTQDLKNKMVKFVFALNMKRPVIDMHDNEDMVKRTIEEFRSVYQALEELFHSEISSGILNPLMQFMFTQWTTKLIGFRRRISTLIGYTGGESLEQISFSDRIKELNIQPYSLWKLGEDHVGVWGDKEVLSNLPQNLREEPTLFIEDLPFYKRPYLNDWMGKTRTSPSQPLKISDLFDLGFDPTRLREFYYDGADYIFERISPHFFHSLVRKRRVLREIERDVLKLRFRGAAPQVNAPLLIFRDRGNIYVLRRKVAGIHSQEALDQLKTSPRLKEMNRALGIDRKIALTIDEIGHWLGKRFKSHFRQDIEDLTYFIPWDIEMNLPKVHVDVSGISLPTIWIA
jgi:hypothetical protein